MVPKTKGPRSRVVRKRGLVRWIRFAASVSERELALGGAGLLVPNDSFRARLHRLGDGGQKRDIGRS